MIEPMNPLPTNPDDPRLEGWYHTMELGPGLVTKGVWDHRATVDRVGLPASLAGKTALDVGTADGFWAFEMERRDAQVTAIDVARHGDVDLLPQVRDRWPEGLRTDQSCRRRFATAHKMLGSRVEYKDCNVYDLSPERLGTFDVVFCGAMLVHLINPLQALINIRRVTREFAVIETSSYHHLPVEAAFPDQPFMWFGCLDYEGDTPGNDVTYWSFTLRALCDMLIYAGFAWVEPIDTFPMRRGTADSEGNWQYSSAIAHVAPNPDLEGYRKVKAKPWRPTLPPYQPSPMGSRSRLRRLLASMRPGH